MLQQILRDMYVDPELLAELDETQKQTLFCKMREEQVRRWLVWDEKLSGEDGGAGRVRAADSGTKKSVQFLQGEDGEPWVWVMGEHRDDRSIDTILLEEAKDAARLLALQEAEQLRQSVERQLTQLIDCQPPDLQQKFDISPKETELEEALEIYCSVDELRERIRNMRPELALPDAQDNTTYHNNNNNNHNNMHFHFIEGKRDVLQEIGLPASEGADGGVSNRVAAWERRVAAARAGDILRGLRQRRARQCRHAEQRARHDELTWRQQERKAKQAEEQMRQIARTARQEHRRACAAAPQPPDHQDALPAGKPPPSREAIEEWFRTKEAGRGAGRDEQGQPAEWFHGLITRLEAESILMERAAGSFLVRVSEKIWGYAISYRAADRCKHYLVDAACTHYHFLGDSHTHASLAELVQHHKTSAITESGGELLLQACPAPRTPAILSSLSLAQQ